MQVPIALAWPGLGASEPASPSAHGDWLLGGCRYRRGPSAPQEYALARVDPATASVNLAACTFLPHGWALDPANPRRAFFFEKEGPGAAEFDLASMSQVRPMRPVGGRHFYGHGTFTADGRWLLSTESDPSGRGMIGIRDAATLAYQGEFPSHGWHPHDCHLVDAGKVLVIANGGGSSAGDPAPCVAFVDARSGKLLHRHTMPAGRPFNTGHLAPVGKDRALVVSAPLRGLGPEHPGAVSWCDAGAPQLRVLESGSTSPVVLTGEALSPVVLPERDLALVTHPTPGWISLWRLSDGASLGGLRAERVRGLAVAASRNGVWVSYGPDASLGYLDLDAPSLNVRKAVASAMLAGSHLLAWRRVA